MNKHDHILEVLEEARTPLTSFQILTRLVALHPEKFVVNGFHRSSISTACFQLHRKKAVLRQRVGELNWYSQLPEEVRKAPENVIPAWITRKPHSGIDLFVMGAV